MFLYRLIVTFLAPVVGVELLWRVLRGRERVADLNQRLGGGAGDGPAIWLHGASNGELTSARRLIEALLAAFPGTGLIVTTNTTTARDMVQGWGLARVEARLAPLDLSWALARFRARWRPVALIVLENELWPNRILTAREPVLCVAARMSAKSGARWARLGGLVRALLGRVDWLSAQDDGSAGRFVSLGLDAARLGPVASLKPGVRLAAAPADQLADLAQVFTRENTVLAASTHEGEDAVVLSGFATALAENPRARLIIAPRHPRRAAEIADLIAQAGLTFAVRSKGQAPDADTQVYLADTLGEMALWYALAGITFVGGSLVDKGGHTPFEPALAGSAILHGPHVANFATVYRQLDAAGGAVSIGKKTEFAATLTALSDPDSQDAMAQRARQILDALDSKDIGVSQVVDALRRTLSA